MMERFIRMTTSPYDYGDTNQTGAILDITA
jgi:hypothetical protein